MRMLDTEYLLSWRGAFAITATIAVLIVTKILAGWIAALRYFKGRGIPGPTPWPMFGNFYQIISAGIMQNDIELKKKYGPIVGTFEGSKPIIVISDLNFMKSVMIKDFHNFTNRRTLDGGIVTKPIDKMLTLLKDEEWKNVRSIVSGAFSSGKLKLMTKCINTCVQNYMSFLDNLVEKHDGILEATTFSNYTLDVICACSFGIDTDTINNPDTDLVRYLKKLANPNLKDPRLILAFLVPKLAGFLVRHNLMNILDKEGLDYMERLMNQIIEMRTSGKEKRNDFIQMVLEYQKEEKDPETFTLKPLCKDDESNNRPRTKRELTNSEILAQSILFVLAGYDTTASTLRFIAYNIATHAECQEKLINEIDRVLEDFNGEVSYESVSKMNYLDMVIDETLRLYPAAARVDRVASRDYEYGNVKINKGEVLCIPINTIHHDPEIFPNPDEFIPERFSEENTRKREGVAFLGFGAGPRNCVASRFAYLEMKLLIAAILSKYRLTKCDRTVDKMVLNKAEARAAPKDPIVVKVVRR